MSEELPYARPAWRALRSIESGHDFVCGINPDGYATCWTKNYDPDIEGLFIPPEGPLTEISVGNCMSCGIDEQGEAQCWTDSNCHAELPPAPPGPLHGIAVATGNGICALRDDDTLACWGFEAGDPLLALAPEQGRYAKLCASHAHFCALDLDGFATCWGQFAAYGSLPSDVPFTEIACSPQATCAIDSDDRAQCWGYWLEDATSTNLTQPPELNFRSLDLDGQLACGVTVGGDIVCWGENGDGGTEVPDGFP